MSLIFQESKCELDTFSKGRLKNKTSFGFHISIIPGIALLSTTYYIFKAKSNLVMVDCLDCQFEGDLSDPYQQNYKQEFLDNLSYHLHCDLYSSRRSSTDSHGIIYSINA